MAQLFLLDGRCGSERMKHGCSLKLGRKEDAVDKKIHKWPYNVKASAPQAYGAWA